jgi:hypothetical protein
MRRKARKGNAATDCLLLRFFRDAFVASLRRGFVKDFDCKMQVWCLEAAT